jgi:hypothetical protein
MADIESLPLADKRLILGATLADVPSGVVRCPAVDVEACGAVAVAVAELNAAVGPVG